jgi:signal transduction histidine kinase/HPt (histidine-containing phosphotransfer) domain-containing protein
MPSRVLIVEDSPTEALRARLVLEREGYQISLAADGKEGLDKAIAEKPDLILLDAIMPRMSGYEVWEKLRGDPQTAGIPVVMITTTPLVAGASLGRDGSIAKPYAPAVLVAKLKEVAEAAARPSEGEMQQKLVAAQKEMGDYQQKLEQARAEIDAAKRARTDFLAVISHELRTPLHELMGMTDLVLSTDLTAEQSEYLNTAKVSANALLNIVSEMIEFVEAEAGQLTLDIKEMDPWATVENVIKMMAQRIQEKGLELNWRIAPDVPKLALGDPRRFSQVLLNVMGNAVKFTDRGRIDVQVDLGTPYGGDLELHCTVRDTGIGIPADKQSVVFQAFGQVDSSTTRKYGGAGMGLAMSAQLVRLMQGRIWVESEVGQGSTFHFTALLRRPQVAQSAPRIAVAAGEKAHLRILLAEDSPTNQLIAVANLKKAGHTVHVANNGRKAVDAYAAGDFDLILMDVAMPEMDGLEATLAIRQQEQTTGRHIPIIAMTAFAMKEYQDKCLGVGMDGYTSKPVSVDELMRIIEPFLHQVPADAPTLPAAVMPAPATSANLPSPVKLEDALEVVGGDVDLLAEVAQMSLEECPEQVELLQQALAQQDAKGVERTAHRLKGVMGNLGGMSAREKAASLESMGMHEDLRGGIEAYKEFVAEYQRVAMFYSQPDWKSVAVAN